MKKTSIAKQVFMALILIAFIAGCASTMHKESTGEYVDDTVITTKVKAEIFKDPMLKVLQINVETFKGVVQLSGFVNSADVSARAAKVAKAVNGVKGVKNDLVVK